MSWKTTRTQTSGVCIICNKRISVGEMVLQDKNLGICHPGCILINELTCVICGGKTGCNTCEFRDDCDPGVMSDLCICRRCSELPDPLESYRAAASKRFPGLGSRLL